MSLLDRFSYQPTTDPQVDQLQEQPQPGTLLARFNGTSADTSMGAEASMPVMPEPELPDGAVAFDPFGDPYFGEGIGAILKKWRYNFTKDVQEVTDEDWQEVKNRWKNLWQRQNTPHDMKEEWALAGETLGAAGQSISTAWRAGQSDKGLLSPVLKGISATVTALGDLFSIPAVKTEQALGAMKGLQEAAQTVESPLPRLDQNVLTQAIESMPLGWAYDFARIALSPSENKWEYTKQRIEEGWHSGRILYSTVFDHTLKEKFLQQYREGRDPALIAMELQNPLAELGGQLLLDPLNLVGVFMKGAKTAKQLDQALEATTASGLLKTEKGKLALKAIQEAVDDRSAASAMGQLIEAQKDAIQGVLKNSRILNVGFSTDSLTTTSRQNAIIAKGKTVLGNMALVLKEKGMGYDGIAEAVLAGIRSVSANDDEMRLGLAALSKLPNANMWLADDYIESFTVLRNMMTGADGAIDGTRLKDLMRVKDPAEFAEKANALMVAAAKTEFKDVNDLERAYNLARKAEKTGAEVSQETLALAERFEKLPFHVKYLNRINSAIENVTGPINRVLFPAYFNLQGGVAVRNIISNQELILLDKGPSAWFKNGKYWSVGSIRDWVGDIYGSLPESMHGFKSLVSAATDRPAWGFGKLMEAGEEGAATRIVGASIRDTFKKMLPKAMPNLSQEIEAGVLTERQAKMLQTLVEKNGYRVRDAVEEFRKIYKVGAVEDWRNLSFVTDFEREGLEALGYWDEIQDLARRGANSTDDVEALFSKIVDDIDSRAELATKDPIALSQDHPGVESWGDLMRASEDGHLDPDDQQLFTAIIEQAEQARLEYQALLDDVALKATQALNLEGRTQDAFQIGNEMNRIRGVIRKSAPATAREAHEITQDAWRWTDEVKGLKKPKPEQLVEYWKKAGLTGDPPLDLDKRSLLRELWKQRFEKVSELWNNHFDAIVGESETVLKQMESVVDASELKEMAKSTRFITQKTQAMRQAVYQNGALKIIPKKDLEFLAKQYGVTVDEIITTINNSKGTQYADLEEVPTRDILNVLKQVRSKADDLGNVPVKPAPQTPEKVVTIDQLANTPVKELPEAVRDRVQLQARQMLRQLREGTPGHRQFLDAEEGGAVSRKVIGVGTTHSKWYRDLYAGGVKNKKAVETALEKIAKGERDTGKTVERLKEIIVDMVKYGDAETGTPPDLYTLKKLGASDEDLLRALDEFNDFTGEELTLEDALARVSPDEELLHDPNMPYFDESGNLVDPNAVEIPPPQPMGMMPSLPRVWNESARGAKHTLENIKKGILERWGRTNAEAIPSKQMDEVLERVASTLEPRIGEMKAVALKIAEQERNFTLLNYGDRTYGDIALARIFPFHFWYTRSYKNWVYRIGENPALVAGYAKYKRAVESSNKDMPDWYKQQLNINPFAGNEAMDGKSFLGIPLNHPLYVNLESTLNPLYGLTGTDYNDRVKRHNWVTATIDDMNKFGPTMYAPIQLAIAAMLFRDGETDVAARWAGRLFPQSVQIKALSSTLFGKPVEVDPAVLFFSNGIDPHERGRMSYAAAQLIQSGQYTPEQVMLDFQAQQGGAWDASYQMATQSRAASAFTSYFLGVGFKPRSNNDVMVEQMYTDLNRLYALSDMMDSERYRMAWEQLRAKYPDGFVDAVLLSRKGGEKRDAALAYEVLNRIPPGNMSEALTAIGLSHAEIEKFYDSKGFTSKDVKFTKSERDRFMAAVMDLSVMLKIPDASTRLEWTEARTTYSTVYKTIEEQLGEDIWDKVSLYYDLKEDDYQSAVAFGQLHPEIFQAQQMKREAVVNTPILSAYYGGVETIETYLSGRIRQQLSDKYGPDIYAIQTGYYDAPNPRAYLAAHPELKAFWSDKHRMEKESEKDFIRFALNLPKAKPAQFQEGFAPQSYTQEMLFESLSQKDEIPTWGKISRGMPDWLQQEIAQYAAYGGQVSKRAQNQLDYLADVGGYYNGDALLRLSVLSMTVPEQPSGGGLLSRFGN